MSLDDVKKVLDENKSDSEVESYLKNLILTKENVKSFVETTEGKKLIQPILDQHFTKGLETWKEKTLPGILDEKIKEKYPDETEEQKRLRKIEDELTRERAARLKAELSNKAVQIATQKNLPVELINYFVGQDEETTLLNLDVLEAAFQKKLETAVDEKFKDGGRSPEPGKPGGKNDKNPWSKEHFNLTEQGKILLENPELAKRYKAQAQK